MRAWGGSMAVLLVATSAFAGPPTFTLTSSRMSPSRGPGGNATVYVLEGDTLTRERHAWGPHVELQKRRDPGSTKAITLSAVQLEQVKAAFRVASSASDVVLPSMDGLRHVGELTLQWQDGRGRARKVVLQGTYDAQGNPLGPSGLRLHPDPSDAAALARPEVKDFAALGALSRLLRELIGDRAFPGGNSL